WKMHGRDLTPLLKQPEKKRKRDALVVHTGRHYGSDTDHIPTDRETLLQVAGVPWYASLHDGRYKYIRTFVADEIEELYDLDTDPEELNNLALSRGEKQRLAAMRKRTVTKLRLTDAKFVDRLPPVGPR
ncbi:MAG: sulfatase/phosphatase domain-containing protein, partial [Verrucomicrobiia bacterium]